MSDTIELLALIVESLVGFAIVVAVAVVFVRRERKSDFKSSDPSMFYPNDTMFGKGWESKVSVEDQKKYTAAYLDSLAEYNKGAE